MRNPCRRCLWCNQPFPITEDGREWRKKYCNPKCQRNASVARWQTAHPEEARKKNLEAVRRWQVRHPDRLREQQHRSDEKRKHDPVRKARGLAKLKEWAEKNPELAKAAVSVRKTRRKSILNAEGEVTGREWLEKVRSLDYRCTYCGEKFTFAEIETDHVIPLSKGGKHVIDNLVPTCMPCNRKKHVLTPEEFALIRQPRSGRRG